MPFKNILVVFSGNKKEFSSFDFALNFSKNFENEFSKTNISVLFVTQEIEKTNKNFSISSSLAVYEQYYLAVQKENEEKQKMALSSLEQYQLKEHLHWKHIFGNMNNVIASNCKFSDLIIISKDIANYDIDYNNAIYTSLFESSSPVVIVPENYHLAKPIKNISLGWDGSFKTARVIRSSLPLLQNATNINIITIGEAGKDTKTSDELVNYLKTMNINSNVITIEKVTNSTAETLHNKALELNSDLLIVGAFTHNKMRELVLGSVTKYLLKNTTIPVLMEH
jgi:nucleotide-binding universal stress UspA family protein